jgi:serine/threonine protein kinase
MLTIEEREMLQLPDLADAVGSGSYGTVYKVLVDGGSSWARVFPDRVGTTVAVKEYRPKGLGTAYTVENVSYEVILASAFSHNNVVKPFAVCISGPALPLAFFPYFNQGSLGSVLRKRDDRSLKKPLAKLMWTARVLVGACLDLLRAIQHVHGKGIVHNDLTPNNILVHFNERELSIKLVVHDFGLASRLVDRRSHRSFKSVKEEEQYAKRYRYVARELILGSCFSKASDMYAVGLMLEDILGLDRASVRKELSESRDWSEVLLSLASLAEKVPSKRPTCDQVLHAFETLWRVYQYRN